MVLHLLQKRGVLPCLQRLCLDGTIASESASANPSGASLPPLPTSESRPPLSPTTNGVHDVYFFDNVERLRESWSTTNNESLGELLVAFFKYYSAEFPYVHGMIFDFFS